ncbi:MAG TPA: phosphodiester glycosidase family protein [Acidimicrobiia bacterium]
MRRLGPLLLVLVVLALPAATVSAPTAGSTTTAPPGFHPTSCNSVAEGVEYEVVNRPNPAGVAYIGHVAPGAPVRFGGVTSNNRIPHGGETLQTTSVQCKGLACILGVNADFHDVTTHELLGGYVIDGRILRSPDPARPQVTLTQSGQMVGGILPWSGALTASDGRTLGLSAINVSPKANQLVLYTPEWGTKTATASGATEIVVTAPEPVGRVNHSVTLTFSALSGGNSTIPAGGAVLSASGTAATALKDLGNKIQAGTLTPAITLRIDSPVNPRESLGGNPMLLAGGRNVFPVDSFATSRQPRTFVGWNPAGDIFIVAVDGRQTASQGLTLAEAADFLRGLGATDALNFDGGGGTTFVVDGAVTNHPIDGGNLNQERGNADTLVLTTPPPTPAPPLPPGPHTGYWMVSADGTVYRFGDARHHGDATQLVKPNGTVDLAPTPSGNGYWVVDSVGHVLPFGDARSFGTVSPAALSAGETVVSLSPTSSGAGYWVFTSRGRVLPFGDAPFLGDMHATTLNAPVLGSIATPSGQGYYMVASDGGIFTFGDARFSGSMGGVRLNAPVQSLVPGPDGNGYWLVASDGGIFGFGAPFRGSLGGTKLNRPVSGMVPFGNGYLIVAEDGGVFDFSDTAFLGSLGTCPARSPIVSVAALQVP